MRRALLKGLHGLCAWWVLAVELRASTSFVFLYGATFTKSRLELLLLRLLRKQLVFIYVGSDARPRYMSCVTTVRSDPRDLAGLRRTVRAQRRMINRQEHSATAIISALTTAQFLTRPFVSAIAIGVPKRTPETPHRFNASGGSPTVVALHSPSQPAVKGSGVIRHAVERLRDRGVDIELITVEGRPNAEVLQALERCDFVIDQVYSDLPWSAFAAEAATFGKPTVVAGYASAFYRNRVDESEIPPSLFVDPDHLEEAIETMATSTSLRTSLGASALAFVQERWSPSQVAERLVRILQGEAPSEWMTDPSGLDYIYGCGQPAENVAEQIKLLVDAFGPSALEVSDKKSLHVSLLNLADEADTLRGSCP